MLKIFLCLLAFSTLESTSCAYLPSARRCVLPDHCLNNSDFYFSFDFLYWEGSERGLEYALKNVRSLFQETIQICEPTFNFEPAFRIGVGAHLPHDHWDLELSYTRFYNQTIDRAHHFNGQPDSGIHSVWTSAIAFQDNNFGALWQNAEAKWKIHAHFIDLFLKHRLCLSSAITFEPAFGLKLAVLQQRYSVLYENGNTVFVQGGFPSIQFINSKIGMKNRSFNLGPAVSVTTKWNFANQFDLLGTLTGTLLASHFDVRRNEFNVGLIPNNGTHFFDSIRENDEFWTLRPQATLSIGLQWSECICRSQSVLHFGFSANYEAQIWWKQNMLFRFIDQTNAAMISPTQGDLFFQGLTINGFADF